MTDHEADAMPTLTKRIEAILADHCRAYVVLFGKDEGDIEPMTPLLLCIKCGRTAPYLRPHRLTDDDLNAIGLLGYGSECGRCGGEIK